MTKENNLKILERIQKKERKFNDKINHVSFEEFMDMDLNDIQNDYINNYMSGGAPDEEAIDIDNQIEEDLENEANQDDIEEETEDLPPEEREKAKKLLKEQAAEMSKQKSQEVLNEAVEDFKGNEEEQSILNRFLRLQNQRNLSEQEGLYLIGIDLPTVYTFLKKQFDETIQIINDPEKETNMPIDQQSEKSLYELTGEYIDEDIKRIRADIMGIRKEISSAVLKPKNVITENSSFNEIVNESKKYHNQSQRNINPKALLTLASILHQSTGSNNQWLRVASLCETIYQYYNQKKTRKQFFAKTTALDETLVLKLNEFWKTDWIFRSPKEKIEHKNNLDFYKKL